jgi:O-antigen/teichoic acid export membrane protein
LTNQSFGPPPLVNPAGTLQRLMVNTGTSFGFRLFSMILAFVSVPILVSSIGTEGYGVILLAGSVMGYFGILNAGVPAGTVKYVAEYEARGDHGMVNEIISSSFVFFLIAGAVVAFTVAAFAGVGGISVFRIAPGNQQAAIRVLYIAAAVAFFSWPLGTIAQALDGMQRYPENQLAMGLGNITGQGLAIMAALAGYSLEAIFLCMHVGILVTVMLQYRALRKALPTWSLSVRHFSWNTLRMIFGYSLWMLLTQIASLLFYQTDRILLGLFLPVSALTVYHVITTPFRYIQEFSALYNSALTPAISATEARQGRKGLDQFIYTASKYSNAFVAPLAIAGALLAGPLIGLWMGPEFLPYVWIAQIACAFQIIWQANSTLGRVFYGSGKVKTVSLIAIAMGLLNVPLGIWWVQEIGVAGVVFSTVAAGTLSIPLQYLFAMPELGIDRKRYFVSSIIKGQWTSWILGALLLPFWFYFQSIESWLVWMVSAAALGILFYGSVWIFTLESRHRQAIQRLMPA